MLRTSAILGLVAAVTMVAIKSILGERLWWPFAIVEFCAAGLLATGAFVAFRTERGSLLAAGWGFTGGITWSTLFHHLQSKPAPTGLDYGLGLLLAVSGMGIALACVAIVKPPHVKPTLTVGGLVIASLSALSQTFDSFVANLAFDDCSRQTSIRAFFCATRAVGPLLGRVASVVPALRR
jgi:hypothetical protein